MLPFSQIYSYGVFCLGQILFCLMVRVSPSLRLSVFVLIPQMQCFLLSVGRSEQPTPVFPRRAQMSAWKGPRTEP